MDEQELLDALAASNLEKVLQGLKPWCNKSRGLRRDWINLSSRFNRLRTKEFRKTSSSTEIDIEYNKILEALQSLIDQVFAPAPTPVEKVNSSFSKRPFTLTIGILLLLVLAIALIPVRQVAFQATVKCTDVNLRLATAWSQSFTMSAQRFNLGPLQAVKGTSWQHQLDAVGQGIDLVLNSGKVEIGPLYIAAGELLGIRCRAGEVSFTLGNQSSGALNVFQGDLSVEPALGTHSFGGSRGGDQLQWTAEPGAQLTVVLPANTSVQMPRQAIKGIEFIKKEVDELNSAILSTKLNIQGGRSISLENGDFLEFGALQEADFKLQIKQDTLEIKVQGITNSIKTGHQKLHSRKPSQLRYWIDQTFTPSSAF